MEPKLRGIHIYSTRLDTAYVRNELPNSPKDVPVRVVVISPFASDETVVTKAKVAKTKKDYIIDRIAIKEIIDFWKSVKNPYMMGKKFNQETFNSLPVYDVSEDMFITDNNGEKSECESVVDEKNFECRPYHCFDRNLKVVQLLRQQQL